MNVEEYIATRVQPGEVVFIRSSIPLSAEQVRKLADGFEKTFKETGIQMVLLDSVLSIEAIGKPEAT